MKNEYDLSKLKRRKNPYARILKKPITIRVREDVVEYFKKIAIKKQLPYQNLINHYLLDCMQSNREITMKWE